MKYIQSFYQYPVTFSSIGKTIPARNAVGPQKNLAEITEKELEKLKNCEPFFRELVDTKKYRVLDRMPESYKSSAARINEATEEAAKLRKENEALKAQLKLNKDTAGQKLRAELEEVANGNKPTDEKAEDKEAEPAIDDAERTKQYDKMTYAELQDACKYAGIEYKNKKKAELVKQLLALEDNK